MTPSIVWIPNELARFGQFWAEVELEASSRPSCQTGRCLVSLGVSKVVEQNFFLDHNFGLMPMDLSLSKIYFRC